MMIPRAIWQGKSTKKHYAHKKKALRFPDALFESGANSHGYWLSRVIFKMDEKRYSLTTAPLLIIFSINFSFSVGYARSTPQPNTATVFCAARQFYLF